MRPIDADKLLEDIRSYSSASSLMVRVLTSLVSNQKTIPFIKTGCWIPEGEKRYECSNCWGVHKRPTMYCPTCGSRNRKDIP